MRPPKGGIYKWEEVQRQISGSYSHCTSPPSPPPLVFSSVTFSLVPRRRKPGGSLTPSTPALYQLLSSFITIYTLAQFLYLFFVVLNTRLHIWPPPPPPPPAAPHPRCSPLGCLQNSRPLIFCGKLTFVPIFFFALSHLETHIRAGRVRLRWSRGV